MHAIIFDIDGTLLDSTGVDDALYRTAVESVLGSIRFRPSLAEYDYVTDSGILAQVLDDNSHPQSPGLLLEVKNCFVDLMKHHFSEHGPFPEIPGAGRFLESLQLSGEHAVGIATGGWRETAELKLEAAGLNRFGFPMSTSDDAHDRREIMRMALAKLGSDFDTVTYYGDGEWDLDASLALGWKFVAVGPRLGGIFAYDGLEESLSS